MAPISLAGRFEDAVPKNGLLLVRTQEAFWQFPPEVRWSSYVIKMQRAASA